jgi:hypothetical protein
MLSHPRLRTTVLLLVQGIVCCLSFAETPVGEDSSTVERVMLLGVAPNDATVIVAIGGVRVDMIEVADPTRAGNEDEGPLKCRFSDLSLDRIVFGRHSDATDLRLRLERLMSSKIEQIDRLCKLTAVQREKFQLAARGDIERFVDQFEGVKREFQSRAVDATEEEIINLGTELCRKAGPLRSRLNSGPFDNNSLFAKTIRTFLTAEQASKLKGQK